MKMWIAGAGAGAMLMAAGAAQAQWGMTGMQPSFYVGGQYNYVESKSSGDSTAKLDVLTGRLGAQFNPYLSGEVRVGAGLGSDRTNAGIKTEIQNYYGFYARAGLPNQTAITPYLLGGWTDVRYKVEGSGRSVDGGSYGLGADYNLDEHLALNLEYVRLLDKGSADLDAISLGVTFAY